MNPVSDFELHAEGILEALRANHNPYTGIRIKALFQTTLTKISDSKIELDLQSGMPVGTGFLFLNPIALVQDPKLMFEQVIPHELAHVYTKSRGFIDGCDYADHGEEWNQCVYDIGFPEASLPTLSSDKIDFTANKILKGYATWGCECGRTFKAVFNTTNSIEKYVNGTVSCDFCQQQLVRIKQDSMPSKIVREINYMKHLDEKRNW